MKAFLLVLVVVVAGYAIIVFSSYQLGYCPEYRNRMPGPGQNQVKNIVEDAVCVFSKKAF